MSRLLGQRTARVGILVSMSVSLCCPSVAFADTITLGSAQSFAVLGGAGVAVNGSCCTFISGSLGDYPLGLSSITGFTGSTPGQLVNGAFYGSDLLPLIAEQAQADEYTAYNALAALPSGTNESGIVLGTGGTVSSLTPGTYTFATSAQVDGTLTLDFTGAPLNSAVVFQIGTTLTTGTGAAIDVVGGNSTDAIYRQVGTAATLGANTAFVGNVLASDGITLDPGASITGGRAFAYTGSVTFAATNFISDNSSVYNTPTGYSPRGPTDYGSYGFSGGTPSSSAPEPGTFLLLGIGLTGIVVKYLSSTTRT